MHYRIKISDGGSASSDFLSLDITIFTEEKLRAQVAILRYPAEHTSISTPFIVYSGTAEESPLGLGSFIIMEYIKHARDTTDVSNKQGLSLQDKPVLPRKLQDIQDIVRVLLCVGGYASPTTFVPTERCHQVDQ